LQAYWTINELEPALLQRCPNRLIQAAQRTTGDADVRRRRHLLIDVDPKRPGGTSSTEDEHSQAINVAREIRDWLCQELRWPAPLVGDSGNGAHLMFRIDVPNDEEAKSLINNCLVALAGRFSTDQVDVDTAVGNASRISKAYGSVARKGKNTVERPHRVSGLIDAPRSLECVSIEQLQYLAAMAPKKPEVPASVDILLSSDGDEERAGDVYNRNVRPEQILKEKSWELLYEKEDLRHWRRPGKESGGASATVGPRPNSSIDIVHVFSSNAEPLKADVNYNSFTLRAAYDFDGDLTATAAWIHEEYPDWFPQLEILPGVLEFCRKFEGPVPPVDTDGQVSGGDQVPNDGGLRFEFINGHDLAHGDFNLEYLIPGVLVKGQPMIVAGPQKTLKTSIMIDLALTLSAGGRFLNQFPVAKTAKVALMSGESGMATIQETAKRVAAAHDLSLEE